MSSLRGSPEFIRGEAFERALSAWLQRKGWGVLPVYNYGGGENGAPLLERWGASLILPDLLITRQGQSLWVECKRRQNLSDGTPYGGSKRDTGFGWWYLKQYQSVKAMTGIDVWVVFAQDSEASVRQVSVSAPVRQSCSDRIELGGMAFYEWDQLTPVCSFRALALRPLGGIECAVDQIEGGCDATNVQPPRHPEGRFRSARQS